MFVKHNEIQFYKELITGVLKDFIKLGLFNFTEYKYNLC